MREIKMNKKDLFKSYTLVTGEVSVPNWSDEPVRIQELSAAAIDKMRVLGEGKELKAAALSIIHGVIDEDGKRVFAESDLNNLLEMSVNDLNKVSEAVLKVSGLGETE
jgi:hypothetical protein